MLRSYDAPGAQFAIKNDQQYITAVGYNIYDKSYSLKSDKMNDSSRNRERPLEKDQAGPFEFTFWATDPIDPVPPSPTPVPPSPSGAAHMLSVAAVGLAMMNLF